MSDPLDSKSEHASGGLYVGIEALIRKRPGEWQSTAAWMGLAGGALSPFLGTLSIAVTWFIHSQRATSVLNVLSIVPFTLTLPLLVFGGHCLDLLGAKTAALTPPAEPRLAALPVRS